MSKSMDRNTTKSGAKLIASKDDMWLDNTILMDDHSQSILHHMLDDYQIYNVFVAKGAQIWGTAITWICCIDGKIMYNIFSNNTVSIHSISYRDWKNRVYMWFIKHKYLRLRCSTNLIDKLLSLFVYNNCGQSKYASDRQRIIKKMGLLHYSV